MPPFRAIGLPGCSRPLPHRRVQHSESEVQAEIFPDQMHQELCQLHPVLRVHLLQLTVIQVSRRLRPGRKELPALWKEVLTHPFVACGKIICVCLIKFRGGAQI